MRNYFKFLATTLVAILVVCALSAVTFAASTPFTDVNDRDETLSDAVALLSHLEVTKGTSETTFGTIDGVTRQQMSAFIYRLMQAGKSLDGTGINTTSYKDLVDRTYFGYISWADTMGIIKGTSSTTFNPKGGIVLQDAYTMIIRALGHEDESYVYPFTYIEKAEELGLDEGLDSKINYDSILTRGDVAILLYNTFFAELGKEETKQVERLIGNGSKWVLETKTYHPTLAEDVYDVELGDFTVRATPKYAFNDSEDAMDYVPLIDEYEKDMLHLVAVDDDEALSEFLCEFDGSGLDGAADDYIMQSVKVYYTYETKNGVNKIDEIFFISHAEKTFETSSLEVEFVNAVNDKDYFSGTDYAKCTGKMTAGKETIYFFDAPYSYLKPNYNSINMDGLTKEEIDDEKEILRNEKNVKLVNIKSLDLEKGTYSYYIDAENQPTDSPEAIIDTLKRVYSKGVYKMRFFDVDGDDIYEYAHYMPATYGIMDGDDGKYFNTAMEANAPIKESKSGSELDLSFKPVIYYNEANISGKKFEDGDLVFAYLNPEANMIEVLGVVQSYKGYIDWVRTVHGQVRIDGITFSSAQCYRVVEEMDDETHYADYHGSSWNYKWHGFSSGKSFSTLVDQKAVGEVFEIYYFPFNGLNTVIYYEHLDDASMTFGTDDTLIPVSNEDSYAETFTKSEFDVNKADNVYYVRVYTGGQIKYVPVDLEEMFPSFDDGYSDGEYNLSEITGQGGYPAYVDKISKFVKNSDGVYTIIPLLHAEDDDGKYVGVNRDSSVLIEEKSNKQFGNDLDFDYVGRINKVAGTRFELVGATSGETLLGDFTGGETVKYFTLKSNSRIVIKNWTDREEGEFEYLEFNSTTFTGSVESTLTNIQYILKADPDSNVRADLVLLYAEADDFKFKNTAKVDNSWRIVAESEIVKVDDEEYSYSYTLLNPYTGEKVTGVLGEDAAKKANGLDEPVANGTMIKVKGTKLDEDADTFESLIDTSVDAGLVWITEYNADENYIAVLPVEAAADVDCKAEFDALVEDFAYGVGDDEIELNFDGEEFKTKVDRNGDPIYGEGLYYEINDNTVITVLRNDKAGIDAIENGEFALADISAIAGQKKDFKCYNNKVLDRKGNLGTEYAPNVKAYVYVEEATRADEIPVAEYIIIVVNGDEEMIFTDNDDNFLPKSCDVH